MKSKLIILLVAALMLVGASVKWATSFPPCPPSPITGNATDGYSLPGSLAIGTTGGSATLTLNGAAITSGGGGTVTGTGVSPYPLTGASVFTIATMDGRTHYLPGASPSVIVQLPTITSIANTGVFFMDGKPDAGLTVFCTCNLIWHGSGVQSGTGSTVWVDAGSGNSNFSTGFIGAVRNGVLVWKVIPCDLTWKTKL